MLKTLPLSYTPASCLNVLLNLKTFVDISRSFMLQPLAEELSIEAGRLVPHQSGVISLRSLGCHTASPRAPVVPGSYTSESLVCAWSPDERPTEDGKDLAFGCLLTSCFLAICNCSV